MGWMYDVTADTVDLVLNISGAMDLARDQKDGETSGDSQSTANRTAKKLQTKK